MRVPPSLTYSATTPASRLLTSSMNAGGQDHSRPTNRPSLCDMACFRLFVSGRVVSGSADYSPLTNHHSPTHHSLLVIALRNAGEPAESLGDDLATLLGLARLHFQVPHL